MINKAIMIIAFIIKVRLNLLLFKYIKKNLLTNSNFNKLD